MHLYHRGLVLKEECSKYFRPAGNQSRKWVLARPVCVWECKKWMCHNFPNEALQVNHGWEGGHAIIRICTVVTRQRRFNRWRSTRPHARVERSLQSPAYCHLFQRTMFFFFSGSVRAREKFDAEYRWSVQKVTLRKRDPLVA